VVEKLPEGLDLRKAWDFGGRYDSRNNPARHCSYSYHAPFGQFALATTSENMAVLADRNPWMDPNRIKDPNTGWACFEREAPGMLAFIGNSDTHQREGQNVLFVDAHVEFEKHAACGADGDNIYTIASAERAKGLAPRVYEPVHPADKRDSVLVQEVGFDVPKPASAPSR
jgi:prepilin-type processing-associated H-X9-DG protein